MDDLDLEKLWQESNEGAEQYYLGLEPQLIEIAKKESQGVLASIARNSQRDFWATLIAYIAIIIYFVRYSWLAAGLFSVLACISILYGYIINKNLQETIDTINTQNVIQSIQVYIKLLKNYSKKIELSLKVYTPIGSIVACIACFLSFDQNWSFLLKWYVILGSLIFYVVLYFVLTLVYQKYIQWIWGTQIDELESILEQIQQQKEG